jgi:hypothetical protein
MQLIPQLASAPAVIPTRQGRLVISHPKTMKVTLPCVCLLMSLVAPMSFATTATSYSSFGGVEEPTVIYHPSSDSFTDDSYDNMTSPSSGVFHMELRFSSSSWDGDRATTSTDRQRAEVRQLSTRQKNGETYEYASTWKTSTGFKRGGHFTHVTQVKAADGDNAAPLVVVTILSNTSFALQKCSGSDGGLSSVATNGFSAGSSYATKVRLKTSTSSSGSLQFSINGGSLKGKTGIEMYRPSATAYHPKWGLYRGVDRNDSISTTWIEHKSVSSNKL